MYKILKKIELTPSTKLMCIFAPEVARKARAGQFVILRMHDHGERFPLTITDYNKTEGTITIVFAEVGKSTRELGMLSEGDCIMNFIGPLGQPSEIEMYGTVVCIGGGIGVAPVYPIARSLKQGGNRVISIIGARSRQLLFFEHEMALASDELQIVTDDGSYGRQGFVTSALQGLLDNGLKIDLVVAIGPVPMMRAVAEMTRPLGIKTTVSLNPIMVDGTGMCGGCRVSVGGVNKFACVDGPEFDAHSIDYDNLQLRQKMYLADEEVALAHWHECKCGGDVR
ncbi:MAG TPA: sulfide/dihydroorotate dehydrogenase-like FAD/NAD-binding protein [Pelotomaculum sp.]|nr:sulfide/dihydroorotate dehydrogenase-like FAD/NAD-binding protein [Pelotomaculum sp.]